jgi:D-alanyl-D-alanine carboxypeptidase
MVLKPASTTKIMTALVALDHYPLNLVLTIRNADRSIGQTMDLVSGEQLTVESLLFGLLLHSGNDAAYALAENYPGGYNAFVGQMNNKARQLHLDSTNFCNVSGIDQEDHYTTVSDLARLAAEALKNPIFASIVSTQTRVVTDINGLIVHHLSNKNQLLGLVEGVRGIKTGWTEAAGECLVTDTIRDDKEIITVVLGSLDRFGESATLINWAYRSYDWINPG